MFGAVNHQAPLLEDLGSQLCHAGRIGGSGGDQAASSTRFGGEGHWVREWKAGARGTRGKRLAALEPTTGNALLVANKSLLQS